jgi:microcystin-dependent protein
MSVNSTNPSTLFGGTWEAWGTGRVPVGIDTIQTEFATVEKTGGEKSHKLTINEIPKHRHGIFNYNANGSPLTESSSIMLGETATGWSGNSFTTYEGGGQEHNNLQPYITCYMWKRIA